MERFSLGEKDDGLLGKQWIQEEEEEEYHGVEWYRDHGPGSNQTIKF